MRKVKKGILVKSTGFVLVAGMAIMLGVLNSHVTGSGVKDIDVHVAGKTKYLITDETKSLYRPVNPLPYTYETLKPEKLSHIKEKGTKKKVVTTDAKKHKVNKISSSIKKTNTSKQVINNKVKNAYDVSYEGHSEKVKKLDVSVDSPDITGGIPVKATAYIATCKGCSGITKTEIDVRKTTPNIIAVDPSVIPLGSVVELWVGGYLWGEYHAEDIGGAIKDHKIDVLLPSLEDAENFGIRKAIVVIKEIGTYGKGKKD